VLKDPQTPLIVTEGEKKAAKADQEGFPCIGLVGVYGWQKRRARDESGASHGRRELIDALKALPWAGRDVYIAFDSDINDNRNVRSAAWHLEMALVEQGAVARCVRLPSDAADPTVKVGLDDYLISHGADGLRQRLEAAVASPQGSAAGGGGSAGSRPR